MSDSTHNEPIEISVVAKSLKECSDGFSIIYAEDEPSVSDQVEIFLRKFFTNIRVFDNGEKAYLAHLDRPCDILITDLVMPHMGGVELLTLVKRANPNQKTIAISAHEESSYMVDLINIEVDGFLEKPLDDMHFLQLLLTICKELHEERSH